jgi:hypothetical protein
MRLGYTGCISEKFQAFSLAGCAGTATPAPTVTVTETVTVSPNGAEAAAEEEPASDIPADGVYAEGEKASNFGAEVNVKEAYIAKTVPLNKTSYRSGSGCETYTDRKPDAGGKFLVVETSARNIGDTEDRACDTIDSLYEFKGNPESNADLRPGFKNKMTYVFMAPKDAELTGVVFQDTNNEDYNDYTGIRFDKPLK